jgi:hypothetical protein
MFEYFRQERLLFEVWPIFLLSPKISLFLLVGPARKFELMFRAYAPSKTFFEKIWKLPIATGSPFTK